MSEPCSVCKQPIVEHNWLLPDVCMPCLLDGYKAAAEAEREYEEREAARRRRES